MSLTPQQFIARWLNSPVKERAAAQSHFNDLCEMLGEPRPLEADPTGLDYGFEVGATKTTGGNGFADVFKRGHFAWEYKGTRANLDDAFAQLQRYAVALDNPPLLIVSDIGTTIRIHTNWTNSVSKRYDIPIADLGDPVKRGWLKSALSDPEALKPAKTRQELTEEVAGDFATVARLLRERGHPAEQVAHFINRLVFCMFAEDVKLLPDGMFTKMLDRAMEEPDEFTSFASDLFAAMTKGGRVGFEKVKWFNGGLFDDDQVFPLTRDELRLVHKAAQAYWGDIDPSILGTLFERGLDPDKRSQLGAHYTDPEKIMMIVEPVIVQPLTAEWEEARAEIAALMVKATAVNKATATRARNDAQAILDRYLKRLTDYRVLDPACGSGNFLYVALRALKDLEQRAQVEAEAMGLPPQFPRIGPDAVKGIELNPYAAELARVSVWIGEIQWMIRNGFSAAENPILRPLDNIECRDALRTWVTEADGSAGRWVEAQWPEVDAIIGNPPFLGGKLLRSELGDVAVDRLFSLYDGRVPQEADLVVYWLDKGRKALEDGRASRVGFVATNSIRGGANRRVVDRIADGPGIVAAWSDEPWTVEGAAVRVSLLAYGSADASEVRHLDGRPVQRINPVPDHKLQVIARDDDVTFGVLLSRLHYVWSLAVGNWHGVGNDPRYTITTCFHTFPFPGGLTPNLPAADYAADPRAIAIADAAKRLNELRENWLNPSDLVRREPEVVPGFPDRILPVDDDAAEKLKGRTLTKLYNERPTWLDHAHRALDAAVAAAYGWPADLTDDEVLARLFALNQERAEGVL